MEPHMIDNYISVVFVIVVNHVGFIIFVINTIKGELPFQIGNRMSFRKTAITEI